MPSCLRNIRLSYAFKFLQMFHLIAGVMIPFFTVWGGISFFKAMVLQASFRVFLFILEVPTGAVADRFSRKASMACAGLCTTLAAVVYSSYPNFWIFMLGSFLWAAGLAFSSGADQALVYDSLKELGREGESKKILGRWNSLDLVAIGVAAPLGSLIAEYMGLRYAVLLMSIPMFAGFVLSFFFVEPTIGRRHERKKYLETVMSGFKYLRAHPSLKILAFDVVSISALSFFTIWVYQVVLMDLHVPIQ